MTALARTARIAAAVALAIGTLAASQVATAGSRPHAHDGLLALSDASTGQIYTVRPDGSDLTQLTHGGTAAPSFAESWSPDGRHLVFTRAVKGADRLYEMAADGSGQRSVFTEAAGINDENASYFPDGRHLVFARCATDGSGCVLATIRLDGTGLHAITPSRHEVFDFWASIAPDGRHIAFTRFNADGVFARVWIMRADGSHARPVTDPAYEALVPDWAPDGHELLFSSNCCRLGGDVYTVDREGSDVDAVTHTPYPLFSGFGVFSPSGTRIAFVSNRKYPDRCCSDVFVTTAGGGRARKVPLPFDQVIDIAWGPRTAAAGAASPVAAPRSSGRGAGPAARWACRALPVPAVRSICP